MLFIFDILIVLFLKADLVPIFKVPFFIYQSNMMSRHVEDFLTLLLRNESITTEIVSI